MKAKDIAVGTKVVYNVNASIKGRVISTDLSDGDEVIAIQEDDGELTKINVNEISIISNELYLPNGGGLTELGHKIHDDIKNSIIIIFNKNKKVNLKGFFSVVELSVDCLRYLYEEDRLYTNV